MTMDRDMTSIPSCVIEKTVKPFTVVIAPLTDEEQVIIR